MRANLFQDLPMCSLPSGRSKTKTSEPHWAIATSHSRALQAFLYTLHMREATVTSRDSANTRSGPTWMELRGIRAAQLWAGETPYLEMKRFRSLDRQAGNGPGSIPIPIHLHLISISSRPSPDLQRQRAPTFTSMGWDGWRWQSRRAPPRPKNRGAKKRTRTHAHPHT